MTLHRPKNVGHVLYGLVLLIFLPGILHAFGLQGLLQPIQDMVDQILSMLPHIVAALILGGVGWLVARLLMSDTPVEGWQWVLASLWLLGGLTISSVGLVGFYVGRIFYQVKYRPNAIVRRVYN